MIVQLIRRFFRPASLSRRLTTLFLCAVGLNLLFGTAFYFAERDAAEGLTYVDSLWWAMVTMTTVGYGDYFAVTPAGRFLVSYPTFLLGIGLLGYFLGSVADVVIETTSARRNGRARVRMKDHILICGYPSAAKVAQIVREIRAVAAFAQRGIVLLCDGLERLPAELERAGVRFVRGSAFSEETLRQAGIEHCHGAFILSENPGDVDSDARTFAIATIIESMEREVGHPIRTVCELVGARSRAMMQRSGADGIVVHEGLTDCLLVQEFLNPGIMSIFQQVLSNAVGSQFYLVETRLNGKKVYDLQLAVLQHPQNIQVIGLIQDGKTILNPSKEHVLAPADRLVILADRLEHFREVEADLLQSAS